jgi:hypothetical protein
MGRSCSNRLACLLRLDMVIHGLVGMVTRRRYTCWSEIKMRRSATITALAVRVSTVTVIGNYSSLNPTYIRCIPEGQKEFIMCSFYPFRFTFLSRHLHRVTSSWLTGTADL